MVKSESQNLQRFTGTAYAMQSVLSHAVRRLLIIPHCPQNSLGSTDVPFSRSTYIH
ncbi:hypothetical protein SK128_011239 [Halocaridina rubra]|uniref:Uncharacterized protein n=1 Tax=Halocaridina rubra TaxID=373956 RepID=A0AAN8ZY29_HALRR